MRGFFMKEERERGLSGLLMISVKGAFMGAADVVPGVSGGTMAFILGIYEELLDAVKSFSSVETIKMLCLFKFRKAYLELPWKFMLFLVLGIASSFLLLAGPINWMLKNHPEQTWSFFFGLVLASVVAICPRVKKWNAGTTAALLSGTVFAYWLVGIMPARTPDGLWFIVLCGALAICAMILPGISGSFILLLLGKYDFMLEVIHNVKNALVRLDLALLLSSGVIMVCFMIGMGIGLASFVRILSWFFKKMHDVTVAVLIGFMLGSLRRVWPWKVSYGASQGNVFPQDFSTPVIWSIVAALAGLALVLITEYVANRKQKSAAADIPERA
jgi:putative membrane protein